MLYRWIALSAPFEQLEPGYLFEALPLFDNALQFPLPTQYNVESQENCEYTFPLSYLTLGVGDGHA